MENMFQRSVIGLNFSLPHLIIFEILMGDGALDFFAAFIKFC